MKIFNKLNIININLIILFFTCLCSTAWAAPMHSVMLSVPSYPEEALTWCGPATAQMIMEGYPSGSCSVLQEDIWMAIQSNKAEAMWDTDPAGLEKALETLCLPPRSWAIHANADPRAVMYDVAHWMTYNNYPVAGLLNTLAHNDYTAHSEHWIVIRGIITDSIPATTDPNITLWFVWFNDPAVNLGDPAIVRFVSGSTWYSEFQPVTKPGSTYNGKYVAVIEPPEKKGIAIAPAEVLIGKLISPDDILGYASKWIEEYKLFEREPYVILNKARPLKPLLVNKDYGGYYIIPYSIDASKRLVSAAVIVNAYTGNFQEVGVFKPVAYLAKEEAINISIKHLNVEKPQKVDAELIFPLGEQAVSRYFPIWKVTADTKVLGVGREGNIYTKIPCEDFSIPLPGQRLQGVTWDGKHLWTLDEYTKKLYSFDPRSGAIFHTANIDLKRPKGLAFDGKSLWVADEETKKIHKINSDNGRIIKTIEMEIPKEKGFKSIEGVTWDGKNLWIAIYAGFSSSFNQIDTETGRIIRSVFADCHPRGITSDGTYIWSICYNGENLPPKIDRRKISDKEHEMLNSRIFIRDIDVRDPSGLVYDGQYLWYSDRMSKKIFKMYPQSPDKK